MEYRSLYALGKEKLAAAGIPEADLDARLLLEYVCHTSRNDLLVHGDREVAETEQQAYEQLPGASQRIGYSTPPYSQASGLSCGEYAISG